MFFFHSQMIARWWRSKSQKNWEVWRVALTLSSLCLLETVPPLKTQVELIKAKISEASSSSACASRWYTQSSKPDYGELIWAWQIPLRRNAPRPVEACLEYRGSVVGTEAVWPGSHHLGLHASVQPSLYRLYGMSRNPQERAKLIFTCLCGRALSREPPITFSGLSPCNVACCLGPKGGGWDILWLISRSKFGGGKSDGTRRLSSNNYTPELSRPTRLNGKKGVRLFRPFLHNAESVLPGEMLGIRGRSGDWINCSQFEKELSKFIAALSLASVLSKVPTYASRRGHHMLS